MIVSAKLATKNKYDEVFRNAILIKICKKNLDDKDLDTLKGNCRVFQENIKKIEYHIPYEVIVKYVMSNELSIKDMVYIDGNINRCRVDDNSNNMLDSLHRNIQMSLEQKNYIDKGISVMKEDVLKAQKDLNDINDMKKNIYTDFITILGIFTAITFAAFGGVQLLGNLFNNINIRSSNQLPFIGDTLILSSLFGLVMYGIIVTLFVGINKVTNLKERYIFDKKVTRIILGILIFFIILGILCLILSSNIHINIKFKL
ncbi:hypothetical protein CPEBRM1_ABPJDJAI_01115 [Companilactobacillus paralimentarius]|uniref:hypothetical protein n=1 Tax=Companilactobacillus paralimentarius TaxID=83526 RepID=UPI00384C87F4